MALSVEKVISPAGLLLYWLVFVLLCAAYFLGRIGNVFFPGTWGDRLIWIGAYWWGAVFYLGWLWGLTDTVVWLGKELNFMPAGFVATNLVTALIILAATASLLIYGTWRARTPIIRCYPITIDKFCSVDKLKIAVISDLHLGLLVGRQRLENLVGMVNSLNPNLILLPGDILDENVGAFLDNHMPDVLRRLQAPLGVYGCLGSHEYIWGKANKTIQALTDSGIVVLRDRWTLVADGFYLIGRDDRYKKLLTNQERLGLEELLAGCDQSRPLILLDHQPVELEESCAHHIDLFLAGHTHHGQLFPLSLLTKAAFRQDWGYYRQGAMQMIVSCGFGTWGPPIRIGTVPEIILIELSFRKDS